MNLLGLDVSGLDVPAFLQAGRSLYAVAGLAWLALLYRVRRPWLALLGVALANAWAFSVTSYPLRSLYGLLSSSDRVGNLALVQVVAAGNSPFRTAQVGQLHFEPFWGWFVALLSGFDPERVLVLYPFLPVLMLTAFVGTLYVGLGGAQGWTPWERAVAAGFATLLASSPFEFAGTYRVPWAMMFLLKPNHALGLVLFPLLLRGFCAIDGWPRRIAVGLLLHLIAWVFVIHMVFVASGIVAFALLSLAQRHPERKRDALDAAVVIGVNLLVVSPYLVMLFVGYPFLYPSERAMIAPFSPHLLEATVKHGAILPLAALGAWRLWRRGRRLDRLLLGQLLGAYAIWAAYLAASLLQQARERDEIYYWVRLLTSVVAAVGAMDAVGRLAAAFGRAEPAPALRALAVAFLALPASLPYWWNPLFMDSYVPASLEPLPDRLRLPTDYIRHETDRRAVFAGDEDYCRYVAALGARRVTLALNLHNPPRLAERQKLEESLVAGTDSAEVLQAARDLGVGYLVATPSLLEAHEPVRLADLEARRHLQRVFLWREGPDFVALFRVGEGP